MPGQDEKMPAGCFVDAAGVFVESFRLALLSRWPFISRLEIDLESEE